MSGTIFDLHAKVSADASPFNKAMDSTASSVTSSLGAIQSAAHTFIGNGVVQAFTRAVNVANEFGQIIADISSISDLNMQYLSNSIRNMENVYGKASRIGNTVYEAISSGIEGTEDEYVKFAKIVGQTSKSIRADIETTGNVLTTLSNAYGMSVSEVSKLADMLFVTVREGKAQGNQLAHTLGLVTNTAAEAGVSLAEMSAVISILSRTQSASQSMIAFNQMLNGLIKPTQEAQREAKKWGIEIGATALQTKGLTAILTEMHDKIGGNVEAINAILGNIRAMRAGTALTGKQFQNFLSVLHTAEKEIGTGVAFEAFTKQTNTAKQALENFETQVDKTFITVGKDFEPLTRLVSGFAESLLKGFGSGEGGSLGVVGRWATYILIIQKTISAIKSTYIATRDIAHKLSDITDKTKEASAVYADNMERANRAIQSASIGMKKTVIPEGQINRYAILSSAENELTARKQDVISIADKNTKQDTYIRQLEKRNNVANERLAKAARDVEDIAALRASKETDLKNKETALSEWSSADHKGLKSKYIKHMTRNYENAVSAAREQLETVLQAETNISKRYLGAKLSKGATEKLLERAKAESIQLHSEWQRAYAEFTNARRYAQQVTKSFSTGKGGDLPDTLTPPVDPNVKFGMTNMIHNIHLRAAGGDVYNLSKGIKTGVDKFTGTLNKIGSGLKDSFSKILGNGGALSKLYNGFGAVTAVLAAWETGFAIGTALRDLLKTDSWLPDLLRGKLPGGIKRESEQQEIEAKNTTRVATIRMANKLHADKKLTDAEYELISHTISMSDSLEELVKVNKDLVAKQQEEKTKIKSVSDIHAEYQKNLNDKLKDISAGKIVATPQEATEISRQLGKAWTSYNLNTDTYHALTKQATGVDWKDTSKYYKIIDDDYNAKVKALEDKTIKTRAEWTELKRLKDIGIAGYRQQLGGVLSNIIYSIRDKGTTEDRKTKHRIHAIRESNKARYNEITDKYISDFDNASMPAPRSDKDIANKYKSVHGTTGIDTEAVDIDLAYRTYSEKYNAFWILRTQTNALAKEMLNKGMKQPDIDKILAPAYQKLSRATKDIDAAQQDIVASVDTMLDNTSKAIDTFASKLKSDGLKDTDSKYVTNISNYIEAQITQLESLLKDTTSTLLKGYYQQVIDNLVEKKKEIATKAIEAARDLNDARVESGAMTESSRALEEYNLLRQQRNLHRGGGAEWDAANNRMLAANNKLYETRLKEREDRFNKKSEHRANMVQAGRITDIDALKGDISGIKGLRKYAEKMLKSAITNRNAATDKSSDEYKSANRRVVDTQEQLTKLRDREAIAISKLNKAVNELHTGMLNTIADFAKTRDGMKMTNDALWHSVNLASRMGRMPRSKPYMVETTAIPNRYKADRMRKQAQGAISASVDSWIMSQKYAEANVGKTVTDIFKFMQQNNTIVVRKQ